MKVLKRNAIKAYKVFNPNWTCRDFQYEVGKSYHHKGNIEICSQGFHACVRAVDCFNYYDFMPGNKVAEVLCWGQLEETEDDSKLCCSNIQIVKELSWWEVLGLCNTGHCNTATRNSGNYNSGDWNSGNGNSGNMNSGYCNSGSGNSGYMNSGLCNSGSWNSGDRNSGNCNSGDWNSGYYNSGCFNTPAQKQIFCFNKLTKKQKIEFPFFLFFDLTEWVPVSMMTAGEKLNHPECDCIGGYLKRYDYKEAFRKSFLDAKQKKNWPDELAKLKAIPNFDYEIFEEISGISKEELES